MSDQSEFTSGAKIDLLVLNLVDPILRAENGAAVDRP